MNILPIIWLMLCASEVVSGQFQLQPENLTVLQGSTARFTATVQGKWEVMTWTVNELLVLTFRVNGDMSSSEPQFGAGFCTSGVTTCVEFTISNITRSRAGTVICMVQGDFGSRTSRLDVEESGTVNILGGTVMVAEDQRVELECVTSGWFPSPTISWTLGGRTVDSNLYNSSSVAHGDSFNTTSVLTFRAVRNTTAQCLATVTSLMVPKSSSVFIVVDPKPPDWTVLISIVVSFGGAALLALLIIGIVFCCKRRKEKQPSYQNEIRRVRTQSQLSGLSPLGRNRGQVNAAYMTDAGVPHADHADGPIGGVSYIQMPDVVSEAGDYYRGVYDFTDDFGPRKHRHATMV
ncbi:immunoglobulin superfamily member 5 [Synchiropus splendidus]|uniref:immunoglobulin superfamily member 5 n=1 Tax=Synchiropus splendidus TaxID=270530 RepID=UPI00237E3C00|nr:immunoglobulin superfamily member 5 [Synchiropus splendidus]